MSTSLLPAFHLYRDLTSTKLEFAHTQTHTLAHRMCRRQCVVRSHNWKSLASTVCHGTKKRITLYQRRRSRRKTQWSQNDGANERTRVERIIVVLLRCFQQSKRNWLRWNIAVCVCIEWECTFPYGNFMCVLCQYYSDVMTLMRALSVCMYEWVARVYIENFIRLNASAWPSHRIACSLFAHRLTTFQHMYIHRGTLFYHHIIDNMEINYEWQCVISCHIYSVAHSNG